VHRTIQRLACVHDLSVGMNPEALNRSTRQTDASLASGAISIALWQPMWNRGTASGNDRRTGHRLHSKM